MITDIGRRHPISSGLPGETVAGDADEASSEPTWGRWFRLIDGDARSGTILMTGVAAGPCWLSIVSARACCAVDERSHLALGPRFRRRWPARRTPATAGALADEGTGTGGRTSGDRVIDGRLLVERRSPAPGNVDVTVTDPSGRSRTLTLEGGHDGLARGEVQAKEAGLWRISDGVRTALAAAGRMNPPEFADLRATPDRLSPFVESTGGGTARLEDGVPSWRTQQAGTPSDEAGRYAAQRCLCRKWPR